MNNTYWLNRMLDVQKKVSNHNIDQVNIQLKKLYSRAATQTLDDFESTYNKILRDASAGRTPSPADLYKLDKYWKMQADLDIRLTKLGDKTSKVFSKAFEKQYINVYQQLSMNAKDFSNLDSGTAKQVINQIWCADGRHWSDRIWTNKQVLLDSLNDELINCVLTGKSSAKLSIGLQNKFNVSYHRASTVAQTEIAHIETQSAKQRYMDYGITKYTFHAGMDCRTCDECSELDGKEFLLADMRPGENAPPIHPNDRCCIIPVVNI